MLNAIPVVGWLFDLGIKASLSVPFWLIWTVCGLGKKYFYFLPTTYQEIPFWHCVGLFIVIPIAYAIVVPKFISISQENKNNQVGKSADKGTLNKSI